MYIICTLYYNVIYHQGALCILCTRYVVHDVRDCVDLAYILDLFVELSILVAYIFNVIFMRLFAFATYEGTIKLIHLLYLPLFRAYSLLITTIYSASPSNVFV